MVGGKEVRTHKQNLFSHYRTSSLIFSWLIQDIPCKNAWAKLMNYFAKSIVNLVNSQFFYEQSSLFSSTISSNREIQLPKFLNFKSMFCCRFNSAQTLSSEQFSAIQISVPEICKRVLYHLKNWGLFCLPGDQFFFRSFCLVCFKNLPLLVNHVFDCLNIKFSFF